jgi:hypothetical protein
MAALKHSMLNIDQLPAAHPRTGTSTYLAIDLLKKNPPPHLYRHELESFLYVLLWGALHFDVASGGRYPTAEVVKKWEDEFDIIRLAKSNFFDDYEEGEKILDAIRPKFQSLRQEWIEPLYWLIRDARRSVPVKRPGQEPPKEDYDKDTYGGRLTFKTFMAENQTAVEIGQEGRDKEN